MDIISEEQFRKLLEQVSINGTAYISRGNKILEKFNFKSRTKFDHYKNQLHFIIATIYYVRLDTPNLKNTLLTKILGILKDHPKACTLIYFLGAPILYPIITLYLLRLRKMFIIYSNALGRLVATYNVYSRAMRDMMLHYYKKLQESGYVA